MISPPCPECEGKRYLVEEHIRTVAEHHPNCDGYTCASSCPIPVPVPEYERVPCVCGGLVNITVIHVWNNHGVQPRIVSCPNLEGSVMNITEFRQLQEALERTWPTVEDWKAFRINARLTLDRWQECDNAHCNEGYNVQEGAPCPSCGGSGLLPNQEEK